MQPFSELAKFQNNFLSPTNLNYIEALYEQWQEDKGSVSPSFAAYFELLEKGKDPH
jgi:2-oxoglutarate dehydrogenase complex dehydrogenase (E1) component-like enzyme